eukprot:2788317-Amphidinium_carterae.1
MTWRSKQTQPRDTEEIRSQTTTTTTATKMTTLAKFFRPWRPSLCRVRSDRLPHKASALGRILIGPNDIRWLWRALDTHGFAFKAQLAG